MPDSALFVYTHQLQINCLEGLIAGTSLQAECLKQFTSKAVSGSCHLALEATLVAPQKNSAIRGMPIMTIPPVLLP